VKQLQFELNQQIIRFW